MRKNLKQFLLNMLRRLPTLIILIALGIIIHRLGSPSQSPWVASIVSIIPIMLILGVVLTLVLCIPGMAVEGSKGSKTEEK